MSRLCAGLALLLFAVTQGARADEAPWRFVSIPDFVNADLQYPQPGWEDALDYVLDAIAAEEPDFVLVAGDLVGGHWKDAQEIEQKGALYYTGWSQRFRDHGLAVYAAIGDHEIGDNPWDGEKESLLPAFRKQFRERLGMPRNGPAHLKGSAYSFVHKGVLFVALDVFEPGVGRDGDIVPQVTGEQLAWFEGTLAAHPGAHHVFAVGHTPIFWPVRKRGTAGLRLRGGRQSPLWQAMKGHGVDFYLCGEVHAITSTERDGVQQIAHGALLGRNPTANYLVATVSPARVELEFKEIGLTQDWEGPEGEGLAKSVRIAESDRAAGFRSVGRLLLDKSGEQEVREKTGLFTEENNPQPKRRRKERDESPP